MRDRIVSERIGGGPVERYRYDPAVGLVLPARVGVRGRFRWQTLDERGVPEIPRNPSGFAIGPIDGIEQPNLITDSGLNAMFTATTYAQSGGTIFGVGIGQSGFEGDLFRNYLHVGTSSVAPDVSDTTLGAEAQRATSSSSFPNGIDPVYEYDSVDGVFRVTGTAYRVVQMTADRNLTEIGLGHLNSTAVNIRSLLLDDLGDPTTVSLLNGKFIRVDHTLVGEIPAPLAGVEAAFQILEYDAANVLVNTINLTATYGPYANGGGSSAVNSLLRFALNPRALGGQTTIAKAPLRVPAATAYHPINAISPAASTVGGMSFAQDAYATGSFERVFRSTYSAGLGNADWHGFVMGNGFPGLGHGGLFVSFDAPYTKVDTDSIQFAMKLTYGRA